LILRQLRVAVLVDRIERMVDVAAIHALPLAFAGDERRWYRGLTYIDDHVIPVIQPSGFLTTDEFRRLDRATNANSAPHDLEGAFQA
jgi:chemotaxis signal transduction protein